MKQNKLDEAETIEREVWAIRKRVLGKEHRDTLEAAGILAAILRDQNKLDEAEAINPLGHA